MPFGFMRLLNKNTSQFVYLVGDEGAILVYLERGRVVHRLFAPQPTEELARDILKLFGEHPNTPIYVLVDVMDQSYVRHKLPPVSSFSLGKLVKRRLQRDFGQDEITGAINLGRDTEGRKDWNFLMISLSPTATFTKWLELIYELPNYFAGVYLLPVESKSILTAFSQAMYAQLHQKHAPVISRDAAIENLRLDEAILSRPVSSKKGLSEIIDRLFIKVYRKKDEVRYNLKGRKSKEKREAAKDAEKNNAVQWKVLVCNNKVSGFRQVVMRNEQIMFTRQMQPIENAPPELIAGSVEQELQNTLEYLRRMSYNPKDGMEVYIVVGRAIKEFISLASSEEMRVCVMTPFEAATLIQRTESMQEGDRFADVLVSGYFGSLEEKNLKLSTKVSRIFDAYYKKIIYSKVVFSVVLVSLVLALGYGMLSWWSLDDEVTQKQMQERVRQVALKAIKKESSSIVADVNFLTDLIAFEEFLTENIPNPIQFTDVLAAVLVNNGKLVSFAWSANDMGLSDKNSIALPITERAKPQTKINFTVRVVHQEATWSTFVSATQLYFDKIMQVCTAFNTPKYHVTHSALPGTVQQSDAIQIQADDKKEEHQVGEEFAVTFELTEGDEAADVNAASPQAAVRE